jgi:hypothetical protein
MVVFRDRKQLTIKPFKGRGYFMANRTEILKKIKARQAEKQAAVKAKYAKMRRVAEENAGGVESCLTNLADACAAQAEAFENLRENLDLVQAPKEASLKTRTAAARNYAKSFKRIAEEAPEQLAAAISEAYHSLDEQAGALEMLAENLGVSLDSTPAEEAFAEEGIQEIEQADEQGVPMGDVPEPPFEGGEEEKEAGGEGWTTDRDDVGKPRAPEQVQIPRAAAGNGQTGFTTDRDENAQPRRPAKMTIPRAQGEAQTPGNKGGSAKRALDGAESAEAFVKEIPQSQGKTEVGAGKAGHTRPMKQIVPSGTPTGQPAESFVRDIPQSQGQGQTPGNKSAKVTPARSSAARGKL